MNRERPIRSYVLRQGRMSVAQQRGLDEGWPRWGINFDAKTKLDEARLHQIFGRAAPLVMEIGFGMGEGTLMLAQQRPDWNYLALDVHGPGVGSLLNRLTEQRVEHVRVMRHDAVEVVCDMLGEEVLDAVHIYFPDPWPKLRHHKRRLIQPEFVRQLTRRLKVGGYLHLATDWQDYAEQMKSVLQAETSLLLSTAGYIPRPDWRPQTRFEVRGMGLGHGVWDLMAIRREFADVGVTNERFT